MFTTKSNLTKKLRVEINRLRTTRYSADLVRFELLESGTHPLYTSNKEQSYYFPLVIF